MTARDAAKLIATMNSAADLLEDMIELPCAREGFGQIVKEVAPALRKCVYDLEVEGKA